KILRPAPVYCRAAVNLSVDETPWNGSAGGSTSCNAWLNTLYFSSLNTVNVSRSYRTSLRLVPELGYWVKNTVKGAGLAGWRPLRFQAASFSAVPCAAASNPSSINSLIALVSAGIRREYRYSLIRVFNSGEKPMGLRLVVSSVIGLVPR